MSDSGQKPVACFIKFCDGLTEIHILPSYRNRVSPHGPMVPVVAEIKGGYQFAVTRRADQNMNVSPSVAMPLLRRE